MFLYYFFFFLMLPRPPRSTRTDTLFPYTTLFRSYHLTNFRITWNGVAGSNLDAAVLVRNAFDKKYIAAFNVLGPTFPVNAVSVGEQRVWAVELHYQF